NLELPWTPLRLEQRVGRVDRIGQPRRVHALHLVAADTSEETVLATLGKRTSRMEHAMNAVGHPPDEHHMAECVIAGRPLPHAFVAAPRAEYAGVAMLDLGREARAEAVRIAAARALVTPADAIGAEVRPVIARVRRHRGARPSFRPNPEATGEEVAPGLSRRECFWLFRLLFTGADGRLLWESPLSLAARA